MKTKIAVVVVISALIIVFIGTHFLKKTSIIPIRLSETIGLDPSQEFQFTLSPDNQWIVYFEAKAKLEAYNLVAFNTITHKKFTINPGTVNTAQLRFQMQNNCWSVDSKYCVLPVGIKKTDPKMIEDMSYIQTPVDAAWTQGNLLGVSMFAADGLAVGYPNNGPDIIIDFSNPSGPILKQQYFDPRLVDMVYQNKKIAPQTGRVTFDQLSPEDFSCSDCTHIANKDGNFGTNSHGWELLSPDGKLAAQAISHGTTWVTPPDLYIKNVATGVSTFVAHNVYYDMHFTSDSKGIYYYGCDTEKACTASTLFYAAF